MNELQGGLGLLFLSTLFFSLFFLLVTKRSGNTQATQSAGGLQEIVFLFQFAVISATLQNETGFSCLADSVKGKHNFIPVSTAFYVERGPFIAASFLCLPLHISYAHEANAQDQLDSHSH